MIKIHLFVPADRLFFEKGSDFMKLEKLSDTQIRCTLSKEDLSQRQLHLSERPVPYAPDYRLRM